MNDWKADPWVRREYAIATGTAKTTRGKPLRRVLAPWYRTARRARTEYQREAGRQTANGSNRQFRMGLLAAWAGDYERAGRHIDDAFTLGLSAEGATGDAHPASRAARLRHMLRREISYEGI